MQILPHLIVILSSGFFGGGGKVFPCGGEDDGSAGVDEESNVHVHGLFGDRFEAATLCANAWDEVKVIGGEGTDARELFGTGGADDIHEIVGCAPAGGGCQYFFIE